jgi:hypothetical protein
MNLMIASRQGCQSEIGSVCECASKSRYAVLAIRYLVIQRIWHPCRDATEVAESVTGGAPAATTG